MKYEVIVEPYINSFRSYKSKYNNYPEYNILNIDRESYMIKSIIENSDEGYLPEGKLVHNLQVGRYCSLAEDIYFLIGRGKDYKHVSTSAAKVFHMSGEVEKHKHREKGSIIIENDVWIGRRASIMSGVTIHNGAIVGAMSHVVKDVPPYAIVGGNPAEIIGYRFDNDIIKKLLTIQWWYWDEIKILENVSYFNDIQLFCDKFYDSAKYEVENIIEKSQKRNKDKYLLLIDYKDNYSITPDVINLFINKYSGDEEKELILYWIHDEMDVNNNDNLRLSFMEIVQRVTEKTEIRCSMDFISGDIKNLKLIMPQISHLIINRIKESVIAINYAEVYGTDIEFISGVDIPINL